MIKNTCSIPFIFYDSFDKGLFDEHKQNWMLVYNKQSVIEYKEKKSDQQQLHKMPDALLLPVNSLLCEEFINPKIPAARAVLSQHSVNRGEYMV